MIKRLFPIILSSVCALAMGAQTLTATYVELADSADHYIRQERWQDAERMIVAALKHEPANKSNYLLWSNLGLVRLNRGDYDSALEAFDIGLASAPWSTVLLANRSRALLALGREKEAVADLDKALEADSTLQWPRRMRGLLRARHGDAAAALEDFRIYSEKFGDDAAIAEARGDIAASADRRDEALEMYRKAYRLEPDAALLVKLLLTAHLAGRLEESEPLLTDGIKAYPQKGELYLIRSILRRKTYQTSAAEKDLKRAQELGVDIAKYRGIL